MHRHIKKIIMHKGTELQPWECLMKILEAVSDMDGYKDIAFFHHLMIEKR